MNNAAMKKEKQDQNNDRVNSAAALIETFMKREYGMSEEPADTAVVDILANIMHYCDANQVDFGTALDVATRHYSEEK